MLVVTHRLPAVRNFDMIVVMQDGMIVEKARTNSLSKSMDCTHPCIRKKCWKKS